MLDYTGIAVVRGADGCFHSFLASLSLSLSLYYGHVAPAVQTLFCIWYEPVWQLPKRMLARIVHAFCRLIFLLW